ncbi:MAG: cisplatin damage response ATP-dependent DNA ligase [Maricaulaceae bacterium]
MTPFADLLEGLLYAPARNAKLALLKDHFAREPDPERGWALAALTGGLELKSAKPALLRALIAERMDAELFALSYDYVGDLAETIALVWPERPGANRAPELSAVIEALDGATRAQASALIEGWLDAMTGTERWALLKLVTGGLRVGVSERLAKQALADFGGQDVTALEELWHGLTPPFEDLFAWLEGRAEKPVSAARAPFRPVMLAQPLVKKADRADPEAVDPDLIRPEAYAAEWKWDGVRVQATQDGGVRRLYTRTGEDISAAFPDLIAALDLEATLDGELLVMREGEVAPFSDLQHRLNRKTVSKKLLDTHPAHLRAYDALVVGAEDWRGRPFRDRRAGLEALIESGRDRLDLSPLVSFDSLDGLDRLRAEPPHRCIEGVMLKRWDSVYEPGRPKGPWFKWKRDPYVVDAVILYAQRGHGKRSSYYSDYTFGVWDGDALTPVGKFYFGFTDEELKRLDAYVRDNTVERFGPVRAVRAEPDHGLVVEVAFEGLNRSPRHKSGLAMRFPRLNRLRWDKPAREADTLGRLQGLLPPL